MKVNRVVNDIKRAYKADLKEKRNSAIESFKALSKALREAQKEAKKGNEALAEAVGYIAVIAPDAFDPNVVTEVKESTKAVLEEFDKSWEENKDEIILAIKEEQTFPEDIIEVITVEETTTQTVDNTESDNTANTDTTTADNTETTTDNTATDTTDSTETADNTTTDNQATEDGNGNEATTTADNTDTTTDNTSTETADNTATDENQNSETSTNQDGEDKIQMKIL